MKRLLRLLTFVLIIALSALAGGAFWLNAQFNAPSGLAADTTLIIEQGTGVARVANRLERIGIVPDKRAFLVMLRLHGMDRSLKAGEYVMPAGISPRDAAGILVKGETVKRYFTIPEGLSSYQIIARLKAVEGLSGEVPDRIAEGSLLPETYQFSFGDTTEDALNRMRRAHDQVLSALWENRAENLPLKTPQEAVILASIVEKETGVAAERAKIAGVFLNRLRAGMRLQSDPTTIYAITRGAPLGRRLLRRDWKTDDPYNTYVAKALPPGPIAHPGRASLAAVLNPTETDALYFVADGTGGHSFARTLAEHNRNVAKWRRVREGRD